MPMQSHNSPRITNNIFTAKAGYKWRACHTSMTINARVCVIWRKQKLQGAGTSGRDKAKMELICEFFQLSLDKAAVLHAAQARNTSAVMLDWHQHQIRGACSRTWRSIPCRPSQRVYNTSHIGSRKEDTCNSHIRTIPGTFIKHTFT